MRLIRPGYVVALGVANFLIALPLVARGQGHVVVPAGTELTLRLEQEVSTEHSRRGTRFQMTLIEPLMAGNVVVAPAGTVAYGVVLHSEGGKKVGKQELAGTLADIMINGRLVPIVTDTVDLKEKGGGGLAILGGGTLIGGLIGGGTGAAVGAVVGTGAAAVTPKRHITIPKGQLARTHLRAPLAITR